MRQYDGWSFSCSSLIKPQKSSPDVSSTNKIPPESESIFCESERKTIVDKFCRALYECSKVEEYFDALDAKFSELVECSTDITEPDGVIIESAYGILKRSPWRTLEMDISEVLLEESESLLAVEERW